MSEFSENEHVARVEKTQLDNILKIMESGNINFLIGAGLSVGAYDTLAIKEDNIDNYFNNVDFKDDELTKDDFCKYMKKNEYNYEKYIDILKEDKRETKFKEFKNLFFTEENDYKKVEKNYFNLIMNIKKVLKLKEDKKEVNIFTTNYDMLLNDSFKENGINYNDGFTIDKTFDIDTYLVIPTIEDINGNLEMLDNFNLIKLHGSKDWKISDDKVDEQIIKFIDNEEKDFIGIMPSHQKYQEILFSHTYYELLNLFSSKLLRSNSVLFVLGFSFRDQHILKLVEKALRRNRTLQVYCISYGRKVNDETEYLNKEYSNFRLIRPNTDTKKYNLENITKLFYEIHNNINKLED